MTNNDVLPDLDLLDLHKVQHPTMGEIYGLFLFSDCGKETFQGKTKTELSNIFPMCPDITVGVPYTAFHFSNETSIQEMFQFRENINKIDSYLSV
jgi:hypothetical protein